MPVNLKKTEFAPADVQAESSSRTFHPEATGAWGKVQSKKNYTGWNANSYIHIYYKMIDVYPLIILLSFTFKLNLAQLTGAVEYTDCISAEG